MTEEDRVLWGLMFLFMLIIVSICVYPFVMVAQRNSYREYHGKVIGLEKNTFLFTRTTITLMTYSKSTLQVTVNGFHDFEIGQTYKIATQGPGWYLFPDIVSVVEIGYG